MLFRADKRSSSDVRDLLKKMLEKDPERRISVEEIMNHPWFQQHLPRGALEMNADIETEEPRSQASISILRISFLTGFAVSVKKRSKQ